MNYVSESLLATCFLALCLGLITGCSDGEKAEGTDQESTSQLRCAEDITGAGGELEGFEVIDDVIALATDDSTERPFSLRSDDPALSLQETDEFFFTKTALQVKADTSFSIQAEDVPEDVLVVGHWGNAPTEPPERVFVGEPCPGDGWLVFPGGWHTTKPICASITVTTSEATTTVDVPLGVSC